jgi:hypothetical protein
MPPRERTEEEKAAYARFHKCWEDAVLKDTPHVQKEVVSGIGKGKPRYYTVTTFSKGVGYGGDRTPIVCSSFDFAKRVVEENMGDIWECSYMLCVISAFYMDCMYGVPWVMKEVLDPGIEATYIDEKGVVRISGRACEEEEYWYKWVAGENGDLDEGRFAPCHYPPNFSKGGPVG